MKRLLPTSKEKGFLILEALVAVVLLSMIIISIFPTVSFLLKRTKRAAYDVEASLLLQEGMEVAYNIFSADFDAYPTGMLYKIVEDHTAGAPEDPPPPRWALFSGSEEIEGRYTRTIEVSEVKRNPTTGERGSGPKDPNSLLITTTIEWEEAGIAEEIKAELLVIKEISQ